MLHKQITILSLEFAKRGVPDQYCRHVAFGVVMSCMTWCHENFTDLLGTDSEMAERLEWDGEPTDLRDAMKAAGLIERCADEWFFPNACPLAPEKVKKQWQRRSRKTWESAIVRCNTFVSTYQPPAIVRKYRPPPPPRPVEDMTETPKGEDKIFDSPPPKQEIKPNGQPGYTSTVDHWFESYSRKYGRKYAFRKADGATLKRLIASHGADAIKRAMDRYLACNDQFYLGHELTLFGSRINRWLASGRAGQPDYGGDGDALPTIA